MEFLVILDLAVIVEFLVYLDTQEYLDILVFLVIVANRVLLVKVDSRVILVLMVH